MDIKNEIIPKSINDICSLIYSVSRLDIEFIDNAGNSILKLFNMKIPPIFQSSRKQTALFISEFLSDKAPDNYLYYTDNFSLSYLGVGFWEEEINKGVIIAGPFLSDIPNDSFITNILESNRLSLGHRELLNQYYKTINILDHITYKSIGNMIVNLTIKPFIYAGIFSPKNQSFIVNTKEDNEMVKEKLYTEIDSNYKVIKDMHNAVQKGLKEEAIKHFNLLRFNPSSRVPNNPLRARKNLAFSFGSGLRTAAEKGGVAPVYLHNISDTFAVLIEKVTSISELEAVEVRMVSDYCDLVKKHSTAGYSPNIRKAIDYINLNFDSVLSLNILAEKINLNSSFLSREFKKETGLTVTEYINKRRVEEAKFLIEQNNKSITEIALRVGFTNHNYFCTVFKKITSFTPTEYLNKVHCKNKRGLNI